MPSALDTVHHVAPAQAHVAMRPCLVLWVHGPLQPHLPALDDLWDRLSATRTGSRLAVVRVGSEPGWRSMADTDPTARFSARFGFEGAAARGWAMEAADAPAAEPALAAVHLRVEDRATVLGQVRASSIRVAFDAGVTAAEIAALGDWAIHHLPLWWGTAGWVFDHGARHPHIADARTAALARRYWGVQWLDEASLQWDALRGMPSVNWLTLVGPAFAAALGWSPDALDDTTALATERLYVRHGPTGLALAAGPKPLPGDINLHEDFSPYVHAARRLAPLLLTAPNPMAVPLARPEVAAAWLNRFADPQRWLDIDLQNA